MQGERLVGEEDECILVVFMKFYQTQTQQHLKSVQMQAYVHLNF